MSTIHGQIAIPLLPLERLSPELGESSEEIRLRGTPAQGSHSWRRSVQQFFTKSASTRPSSDPSRSDSSVQWLRTVADAPSLNNLTIEQVRALSATQITELANSHFPQNKTAKINFFTPAQILVMRSAQRSLVLPELSRDSLDRLFLEATEEQRERLISEMSDHTKEFWMRYLIDPSQRRFETRLMRAPDFKVRLAWSLYWQGSRERVETAWEALARRPELRVAVLNLVTDEDVLECNLQFTCREACHLFNSLEKVNARDKLIAELTPNVREELREQLMRRGSKKASALALITAMQPGGLWYENQPHGAEQLIISERLWCDRTDLGLALPSVKVTRLCKHIPITMWTHLIARLPVARLEDLRRFHDLPVPIEVQAQARMTTGDFVHMMDVHALAPKLEQDWRALQHLACYHQLRTEVTALNDRLDRIEGMLTQLLQQRMQEGSRSDGADLRFAIAEVGLQISDNPINTAAAPSDSAVGSISPN